MKKQNLKQLYTSEGENQKENRWDIYPRPQMKRDSFLSLNGLWEFSANGGEWENIKVPFPPESPLSGIGRSMGKNAKLKYRKTFAIPKDFLNKRVLLHVGAADQKAEIRINGTPIGSHEGGYTEFTLDITEKLKNGENLIEADIEDNINNKSYPYGKQRYKRGGMWYTPISGIWKSVWLESVPEIYVKALKMTPYADRVIIEADGVNEGDITVTAPDGIIKAKLQNGKAEIIPHNPRKWSPEDPYLYYFTLSSGEDTVSSYFAIRTLEIKNVDGYQRLCLNGKPYFFHGLLDQGYYSDGIYTPASPKTVEKDVLTAKSLGFNTLRKHIKTECEHFYYCCDKYGMIVFQDMVNNGSYSFIRDTALPTVFMKRFPDKLLNLDKKRRERFVKTMEETVKELYNHPCICYWTIFNEGWGQFNAGENYKRLKALDGTRFIDTASGWFKTSETDVESLHIYFKPIKIGRYKKPIVLSEFGGYSCKIAEHSFNFDKEYGYKHFDNCEKLEDALIRVYEEEVLPAIKNGLCGAIMTQLSDVEDETNGVITYDRKAVKLSKEKMTELSKKLKI